MAIVARVDVDDAVAEAVRVGAPVGVGGMGGGGRTEIIVGRGENF